MRFGNNVQLGRNDRGTAVPPTPPPPPPPPPPPTGFATDYTTGYATNGVTIAADFAAGPAGSASADKLVEVVDGNSVPHAAYKVLTRSAGLNSVVFYLKTAGRGFGFCAILPDGAATRFSAVIDLTTGAVTDTDAAGTPTSTSTSVIDAGAGWWRIEVSADHGGGPLYAEAGAANSGTPSFNIYAEPVYAGEIGKGVLVAR